MSLRLTLERFIHRAVEAHGQVYDYSKVDYVSANVPVVIVCKEHGDFKQRPSAHMRGQGCKKCAGLERSTTAEFIVKAREIHGDKYIYDKVEYTNNKKLVTIVCREHGDFKQTPNSHLRGAGCRECAGRGMLDTEKFKRKGSEVHSNYYDYSESVCENALSKVTISCPIHGKFVQTAYSHLGGRGCYNCGNIRRSQALQDDFEVFVTKANEAHAGKYKYVRPDHAIGTKVVTIICPDHGEFNQRADVHIRGSKCPDCAESGYKVTLPATVYLLQINEYILGFGITNDFKTRQARHKTTFKKHAVPHELIATYECSGHQALAIENHLKQTYEIIDTGIEGFRKEATAISNLPAVLEDIKNLLDI